MFIKVKVIPSSKKDSITAKGHDSFEICVREKPVQGMASLRTLEILADYLKVKKERIRLVKGFKQRSKIFEILE
ncbi:DUF167 family protein [bacterium]|nr:DUF167 family protein [bacterium]